MPCLLSSISSLVENHCLSLLNFLQTTEGIHIFLQKRTVYICRNSLRILIKIGSCCFKHTPICTVQASLQLQLSILCPSLCRKLPSLCYKAEMDISNFVAWGLNAEILWSFIRRHQSLSMLQLCLCCWSGHTVGGWAAGEDCGFILLLFTTEVLCEMHRRFCP